MSELVTSIKQRPETRKIWRVIAVVLGAFLMACNIRLLVRNAGLFPGGATGLTLLVQEAFEKFFQISIPYTLLNVSINAIPVYIGFRYIGKKFTFYSCIIIFLTGFFTDLIPTIVITNDILLSCVFGGLINGCILSLVLSADATTGGTDFIAIYMSQKKGMDSFNLVLGINAVILTTAGLMFGWDKALYSIIFQYCSTQALHIFYKKYQKQTLFIVTKHPEEICLAIHDHTRHGATIMRAEGSYSHKDLTIVYSVVSAAEYQTVMRIVKSIDPSAFINAIHTEEINGRFNLKEYD